MRKVSKTTRRRASQRGTAYLLVLGITTMLVVFGITSAMIGRVTVEQAALNEDLAIARLAAEVGIDIMHKRIEGDTAWRGTTSNGDWSGSQPIADAKVYFKFVDEFDGNLANDNTQPFRLYAKAEVGDAVRVYSVEFVPDASNNLTRRPRSFRQEPAD
ncbi:MAG: hypothetical protein ACE37H_07270 [Phycisphaeraceae bacterium]